MSKSIKIKYGKISIGLNKEKAKSFKNEESFLEWGMALGGLQDVPEVRRKDMLKDEYAKLNPAPAKPETKK